MQFKVKNIFKIKQSHYYLCISTIKSFGVPAAFELFGVGFDVKILDKKSEFQHGDTQNDCL